MVRQQLFSCNFYKHCNNEPTTIVLSILVKNGIFVNLFFLYSGCLDKHTDCASRVSSNSNYCTENDALLNCWDTCGKCVDGNPNKGKDISIGKRATEF